MLPDTDFSVNANHESRVKAAMSTAWSFGSQMQWHQHSLTSARVESLCLHSGHVMWPKELPPEVKLRPELTVRMREQLELTYLFSCCLPSSYTVGVFSSWIKIALLNWSPPSYHLVTSLGQSVLGRTCLKYLFGESEAWCLRTDIYPAHPRSSFLGVKRPCSSA